MGRTFTDFVNNMNEKAKGKSSGGNPEERIKSEIIKRHLRRFLEFVLWFLFFFLIIIAILSLPYFFTRNGEYVEILNSKMYFAELKDTGQIGDTIGGIMGPFIAIIAAGLTFIAFWVQYKANIQQRRDIAIERFENNLFEMLHIQQEITNSLLVEELRCWGNNISQRGRDVFQFVYEDGKIYENKPLKTILKDDNLKKEIPKMERLGFLDHYFRHLYRIFKYIDDADTNILEFSDKYKYASIVRATLSQYELVLIFYNGFSHNKFKTLIERYAILNNLRPELLASENDKTLYSGYKRNDVENLKLRYNKSAFKLGN